MSSTTTRVPLLCGEGHSVQMRCHRDCYPVVYLGPQLGMECTSDEEHTVQEGEVYCDLCTDQAEGRLR